MPVAINYEKQSPVKAGGSLHAPGAFGLILAATCVGFAVHQHGGEYTPAAITLITFAIFGSAVGLVCSAGKIPDLKPGKLVHRILFGLIALQFAGLCVLWPVGLAQSPLFRAIIGFNSLVLFSVIAWVIGQQRSHDSPAQWWMNCAFGGALALEFFALFILWPVGADHRGTTFLSAANRGIYLYLTVTCGFILLLGFLELRSMRRWWFPTLLIVHSLLGFWTIRSSPAPHIDVWYFQQMGSATLLGGHNPYNAAQAQFPDIYDSTLPGHQQVYGERMVKDGVLQFGFPYPPISLFCSTAGVYFGGDTRYAQSIALTLAGLLIGYCRPGRYPKLAAALLLFTPSVWFVLGRSWTEPFVILFLAGTIFCAARKLRWALPIAFGLFLSSKQYLIFAVPLSFLLIENFSLRSKQSWRGLIVLLAGSALVAAAVTLPLALWNFRAFWFSIVTVQKDAPFRWDALSYLVWAGFNIDTKYTTWVWLAFAGAGIALLGSFWKAARGPAGFAMAMGLTYLIFIAFNKQAFCNYYFFVIGLLSCAIAASNFRTESLPE